ncbi:hypothetical protein [Pseudoalteromonas prydzensis]|uniref:hypothetical protein n=1 Tax=Pseudoalteromonas prydzensis TaxID=182141 RepID=UPI0024BCA1E5|nr:hypothetical protein [Pseudoalteromonas prydzensis]
MRLFLSILFLFFLLPAKAATIAELFGDGVFGTQWGDTIEAVANKLPNTTKESVGDIAWLELKDSKEVLGVKRQNRNTSFVFDSEMRLNGVGVYFDVEDYPLLLNKLTTLFGKYTQLENNKTAMQWVSGDFTLVLVFVNAGLSTNAVLSISYNGLKKPKTSKEELGFD